MSPEIWIDPRNGTMEISMKALVSPQRHRGNFCHAVTSISKSTVTAQKDESKVNFDSSSSRLLNVKT